MPIMKDATLEIVPLAAFQDNYIWLVTKPECRQVIVVDPGDAAVVMQFLKRNQLELVAILITHHHLDHIAGVAGLIDSFPNIVVYGPAKEKIESADTKLRQGDVVSISELGLEFQVLDVPGHTSGHIAYYLSDGIVSKLFCGDTLFSVGCGRLFDGTAEQLHDSLNRLAALPADTQLYCAHEYTLSNIEFARQILPDNVALEEHAKQVQCQREQGLPSLPSTIGLERLINPFLRVNDSDVVQKVECFSGLRLSESVQVFTELRKWKDRF